MRGRLALRVTVGFSLLFLAMGPVSASGTVTEFVDGSELEIGDVVVEGVEAGTDSCLISDVEVAIEATLEGTWLAFGFDEGCRLVVTDSWTGSVESESEDVGALESDDSLAAFFGPPFTSSSAVSDQTEPAATNTLAMSACKTAKQEVRHSGWGGEGDTLSKTTGSLYFCYTGSVIYNASYGGYGCWAKGNVGWYDWLIDACYTLTWTNTSTYVEHHGGGDYHCHQPSHPPCNLSTPDGYYHTLRAREYAYPSGSAYCAASYSGVVVRTPRQVIIQGCSAA